MAENGRNSYTTVLENLRHLEARNEDKSFLRLYSVHHPQGRADVPYSMMVTGSFKDFIDMPVIERVRLHNFN